MRMRRRDFNRMMMIIGVVVVLSVVVVAATVLLKSLKSLKSITITPNFADTELDVNTDYVFSVDGSPARANIKNLNYNVDDATATFVMGENEKTAILHTGAEGTITVYVSKSKVNSNQLTYSVVDQTKKAEEEAAAAAAAAAEAEAAAAAAAALEAEQEESSNLIMVATDSVRMRAEPNTDCDIVRTCKTGETYTKIETVDDWTKVDYNGRECYIKSEFIRECTQEEADAAKAEAEAEAEVEKAEKKAEEKKAEEKKTEEKKTEEKKEEEKKEEEKKEETTDADQEAAAQAALVAAAQTVTPVAATKTIHCKDGDGQFTKAEYDYFIATWSYTGMAEEMMSHHTIGELHELYNNTH